MKIAGKAAVEGPQFLLFCSIRIQLPFQVTVKVSKCSSSVLYYWVLFPWYMGGDHTSGSTHVRYKHCAFSPTSNLDCFKKIFWPLSIACGTWVPKPGIEPTSPALESGVLTFGPPGKSLQPGFLLFYILSSMLNLSLN